MVARLNGVQKVVSSNLTAPTIFLSSKFLEGCFLHLAITVDLLFRFSREGAIDPQMGCKISTYWGLLYWLPMDTAIDLMFSHQPMGFRLHKLIVCLLLAGPLAWPGWGHARCDARLKAEVLEEWQAPIVNNSPSATFALKVRYTYGLDLVKQDRVSGPAVADTQCVGDPCASRTTVRKKRSGRYRPVPGAGELR